ncbi:exo-alpha-sialidase [Flavisolibacter sp. BT320]|nr:exo-alpha-sialidase [Flavisolibacter longurius]
MNKQRFYLVLVLLITFTSAEAQLSKWQQGVLVDEFIYDTASFPQAHSATIVETPAGLVAAWFGGTREGNPDVEIYVSRLVNNKWTPPVSVADGRINDTVRKATYNPVLFQIPGGDLLLFYKIGNKVADWKGFMKRSKDNGLTWSERISLQEGFLGPIKNKPEVVKGKIIAPSSFEGNPGWRVHFEVSDDRGETWRKVGPINSGTDYTIIQPSILKHKDGKLQMLARSKQRALITSWSADGGETWSKVEPSGLPNNNSGTDAVTMQDGRHLLVYNHVRPHDSLKNGKGARTPLNVAISPDGKKWFAAAILEDSPISQYSYPSVIQSRDGMVHVVYTWRRQKIKYVKIDPSKLVLKEIVNGKWPALKGYQPPASGEITKD